MSSTPGCVAESLQLMYPSGPHRLFFAAWPDAHARAGLQHLVDHLEADDPDTVRWVRPSRHHLTLCFLGSGDSFPSELAACALEAAARVRVPAIAWQLDRVASFRARHPPYVASGPDTAGSLSRLHDALANALYDCGMHVEDTRPYHPHVTLGYAKGGSAPRPRAIAPIAFPVNAMALLHSAPGTREYRQLGCWPLLG